MSFFKALKALDVKAWANGPGLGRYVIRSAESAAYVCSRAPDSCRARFAQRWSHCALSALSCPCFAHPARWAGLLHLAPLAQYAISLIRLVRYVVATARGSDLLITEVHPPLRSGFCSVLQPKLL